MNEEFNPYAAPQAAVLTVPAPNQELPLASRWRRLVASFLDSLILMVIFTPLQFLTGAFQREIARQAAGGSMFAFRPENILWAVVFAGLMVGINWNFLLNGQTIGKKALKIRIDRIEGGICDRNRLVMRRILLPQVLYLIPVINVLYMVVDCLMILFRNNKRALHDEIAGTKVVDLRPQYG